METEDTFKIAEILVIDDQDLVQKAVGGWVKTMGVVRLWLKSPP